MNIWLALMSAALWFSFGPSILLPRQAEAASVAAAPPHVLPPARRPSAPSEILDRLDDLYRGESSHGTIAMRIVTEHWSRELTIEQWSLGRDRSLVRILAPQKEKDSATLRIQGDVWNWLPNVSRVVKISSSMMSGAWMGSHLTNDDLVKQSRFSTDYDSEVTFEGSRDGVEVLELTMIPRSSSAVVWGKVVAVMRSEDLLPIQVVFYDEDLHPSRTLSYSEYRPLGGRLLPTVTKMVPADRPAEYTQLTYSDFAFALSLDPSFFSLRNLEK